MNNKNYVTFEKQVVRGEVTFRTVIYAVVDNMNPNLEDITVDIFHSNMFDNNSYTYETSKLINDENRYVNAVYEAINDYVYRQYKNVAINKLNEWDGNVKS